MPHKAITRYLASMHVNKVAYVNKCCVNYAHINIIENQIESIFYACLISTNYLNVYVHISDYYYLILFLGLK